MLFVYSAKRDVVSLCAKRSILCFSFCLFRKTSLCFALRKKHFTLCCRFVCFVKPVFVLLCEKVFYATLSSITVNARLYMRLAKVKFRVSPATSSTF